LRLGFMGGFSFSSKRLNSHIGSFSYTVCVADAN
jgi:hypothetical protein